MTELQDGNDGSNVEAMDYEHACRVVAEVLGAVTGQTPAHICAQLGAALWLSDQLLAGEDEVLADEEQRRGFQSATVTCVRLLSQYSVGERDRIRAAGGLLLALSRLGVSELQRIEGETFFHDTRRYLYGDNDPGELFDLLGGEEWLAEEFEPIESGTALGVVHRLRAESRTIDRWNNRARRPR